MGTWGPGPFENDPAMDWALEVGRSRDPDLPERVLREVEEDSWITALAGAKAVAATEAIAASRGRAAERLPDEIQRWLKAANFRADAATADLALRVLAKVQGEDSELHALWEEVDGSPWHGVLDDLRRRLREPERPVIASLQARRQDPGPAGIGDVIQLLTSTGQAVYVQFVGRAEKAEHDLIRIMPGYWSSPVSDTGLASMSAGDTAFFSQGSFRLLMGLTGSQARGNYPVPASATGPQPLKA